MPKTSVSDIPDTPPAIDRTFNCTVLVANHHKYWRIRYWPEKRLAVRTWGRIEDVCVSPAIDQDVDLAFVEKKIREKTRAHRNGDTYVEVKMRTEKAVISPNGKPADARVAARVEKIFNEANESIASTLNIAVDALAPEQIILGREALRNAVIFSTRRDPTKMIEWAEAFYNRIPTRLPRKIDPLQVAESLVARAAEEEDRLQQLETAVVASQAEAKGISVWDTLGAKLDWVEGPERDEVERLVRSTIVHEVYRNVRIKEIISVHVHTERAAWEANTRGRENVVRLFHGTQNPYMRHILRTGLTCPRFEAHGRNYGHGIYFAPNSSKSMNFAGLSSAYGGDRYLLVADVALGRCFVPSTTGSWREPPSGYDSIWAQHGKSGINNYDEYVVFRPEMQTIRYLVVCGRV